MLIRNKMYLITRALGETTPVFVPAYEALLLQLIHGEGNVEPVDDATARKLHNVAFLPEDRAWVDEALQPNSSRAAPFIVVAPSEREAMEEYNRLAEKYGRHSERDMSFCEFAFGLPHERRLQQAMRDCALSAGGARLTEANAADNTEEPAPLVDHDGEDGANPEDVANMPLEELRASLDALGVKYAKSEPAANLRAKLRDALAATEKAAA